MAAVPRASVAESLGPLCEDRAPLTAPLPASLELLNLPGHTRALIVRLWSLRLRDAPGVRVFQSKFSQDEQQYFIARLTGAEPLSSSSIARMREVCASDRRLDLEDKQRRRCAKVGLDWAQGVDVIDRAQGTLALTIKFFIDARKVKKWGIDTVAGWDPEKLFAMPLDVREAALLQEVWNDVLSTRHPRTVLVLVFVIHGPTNWPKQEYDGHITKMVLRPDGTASYEDHAMSTAERLEDSDIGVWVDKKGRCYAEPSASSAKRQKTVPRPDWAQPGTARRLTPQTRWQVVVYETLRAHLERLGCELVHNQLCSLQSFATPQCAVAMLFDLFVCVPDAARAAVCSAFRDHPDRTPPRRKADGDDRSGNDVLMQLFETYLQLEHQSTLRDATLWSKANSLEVGSLLSSGVCNVCDQIDSPESLLLCEHEMCPCAAHTFCADVSSDTPWRCPLHACRQTDS